MATIKNVVLAGVKGNLGGDILSAVVSSHLFNVTVFTRHGSTTPVPVGVKTVAVDYESVDDLAGKLIGQDAVVSTLGSAAIEEQKNLINAAAAAGVVRFLPSEFGSDLDNANNRSFPVYAGKIECQELLKSLALTSKITYTFVYNGAFLDWGVRVGFVQDPRNRRAILHDGGTRRFTATTLATVGKAVVGVLTHPTETKNRSVRVGEAVTTLKELLGLAQEIVGRDGWTVTELNTANEVDKAMAMIKQGIFNEASLYPLISRAIWGEDNGGFFAETDNEMLGIKELDKPGIKKVLQDVIDGNL
ncbi:hypothetical protein BBP40_004132 [Aspergillus hancockii]|nr:hypothetical protein BBP40_004132 [Aspergillus hancockii]